MSAVVQCAFFYSIKYYILQTIPFVCTYLFAFSLYTLPKLFGKVNFKCKIFSPPIDAIFLFFFISSVYARFLFRFPLLCSSLNSFIFILSASVENILCVYIFHIKFSFASRLGSHDDVDCVRQRKTVFSFTFRFLNR